MNKMGMMRYVVFMNHKWEEQYPIASLQYAAASLLVAFAAAEYLKYAKIKTALTMIVMQAVTTLVFVVFTLGFSTESFRSYYFISLILAIVALIQGIKVLMYSKR
jgi:intracellular septation protein A